MRRLKMRDKFHQSANYWGLKNFHFEKIRYVTTSPVAASFFHSWKHYQKGLQWLPCSSTILYKRQLFTYLAKDEPEAESDRCRPKVCRYVTTRAKTRRPAVTKTSSSSRGTAAVHNTQAENLAYSAMFMAIIAPTREPQQSIGKARKEKR